MAAGPKTDDDDNDGPGWLLINDYDDEWLTFWYSNKGEQNQALYTTLWYSPQPCTTTIYPVSCKFLSLHSY